MEKEVCVYIIPNKLGLLGLRISNYVINHIYIIPLGHDHFKILFFSYYYYFDRTNNTIIYTLFVSRVLLHIFYYLNLSRIKTNVISMK